jgi:hypothetical protein
MPARDAIHDAVKAALIKGGWTITHDPYSFQFGDRDLYADLGAERALGAEKGDERIAVEVKSFVGPSPVHDLENAIGQFILYQLLLKQSDPERRLFLAMPERSYRLLLSDADGQLVVEGAGLSLLTVDATSQEIIRWLK